MTTGYVGPEAARWALLACAFDWLKWNWSTEEQGGNVYGGSPNPPRPDNGAWTLYGYETIDWKEPAFVGLHGGYVSHDKNEVIQDIDFGQYKFWAGNFYEKTPEHLTYPELYTLWLVCTGKGEAGEKGYVEKLLEYGYLKEVDGVINPNVVIFDRSKEKPEHSEMSARLTVLKNEINALFMQAPSITRGYVVEQALEDGWLGYDGNTINTIGAYIYL